MLAELSAAYRSWRRTRRDLGALQRWSSIDEARRRFYGQFVLRGDLVFDIGANVGNRSKVFLQLGAQVVAAEPQQYCQRVLRAGLGSKPGFHLETRAIGASEGVGQLHESGSHRLASMSPEWIGRVAATARFGDSRWFANVPVAVTTLDALIDRYGRPAFVKIDVEGYEAEVVRGLSVPLALVALEFTPEHLDDTRAAIAHAVTLGDIEGNLVLGEGLHFESARWMPVDELLEQLDRVDPKSFGDVYLRMWMHPRDEEP